MNSLLMHVAQIGVFVFSFLIFVRNLDESLVKRRIKPNLMPKIVTAFVLFAIFGSFFAEYFVFWMLFVLIIGLTFAKIVQKQRNKAFEAAVSLVVQQIILNVSAGNSFKQAYFSSICCLNPTLKATFNNIWQIKDLNIKDFPGTRTFEFTRILLICRADSSTCADLLREFRRKIQLEDQYRQKIRSALSQIYTQIGFIGLFYVGLLFYGIKTNLHLIFPAWIFLSFLLIVLGSFIVWYLPRRSL